MGGGAGPSTVGKALPPGGALPAKLVQQGKSPGGGSGGPPPIPNGRFGPPLGGSLTYSLPSRFGPPLGGSLTYSPRGGNPPWTPHPGGGTPPAPPRPLSLKLTGLRAGAVKAPDRRTGSLSGQL